MAEFQSHAVSFLAESFRARRRLRTYSRYPTTGFRGEYQQRCTTDAHHETKVSFVPLGENRLADILESNSHWRRSRLLLRYRWFRIGIDGNRDSNKGPRRGNLSCSSDGQPSPSIACGRVRLTNRLNVLLGSLGRRRSSEEVEIKDSSDHVIFQVFPVLRELDVHPVRVEQEDGVCRRVLSGNLVNVNWVCAVQVGVSR